MSLKMHNVPAMPTLAMLGDNGGVVTVNPEWCDWYELVFGVAAGEGYIKGKEIMHQIDGTFSEFFERRTEAMKSAIHTMLAADPNRPTAQFRNIAEARKSMTSDGKHAMDFDKEEQVFTFDGYFSVKDMEAILFIRRAEDLVDKAKKKFGGFFTSSTALAEEIDVNQLMQVLQPSMELTDVDSEIFAPSAMAKNFKSSFADLPPQAHEGYADRAVGITEQRMYAHLTSPMAEQFNSVVEAHATLTESGILSQNLSRAANGSFHIEGYFTPKDLEAILYLYRNNDPMVFPEKDANGKPDGDGRPRKTFMELLGYTEESCPETIAAALRNVRVAIDEYYENRPNPSIEYLSGATSTRKVPTGFEAETTFPVTDKPAYKLTDMHGARGVAIPISDEYAEGLGKLMDGLSEQPSAAKSLLPTGNDTLNRMLREGGGLRRGEWPGEVASRTAINSMVTQGGMTTHSFEEGDDDYPMLTELLNKLDNFDVIFEGLNLDDMRLSVDAPWAHGGSLVFKKEDGFYTLVVEKEDGAFRVASFKLTENGLVVVFEHNSTVVSYHGFAAIFEAFNDISPEKVKAAVAAIKAEHGE